MEEENIDPNQLNAGQLKFEELPPEMKVNVIISDMLTTIDRLVDMKFALNQVLMENPELGAMQPEAQPHIHDEHCGHDHEHEHATEE
jgi:hypothetical protein|tara:strand:- start:5347 stop:5607 length:261 start_codon:yes stop_codon:yes gene_type:complete